MRNAIYCCEAADLFKELKDRSVGSIITDPPFHISIGRPPSWEEAPKAGFGHDPWTPTIDGQEGAIEWTRPIMKECGRVIRLGGALVVMGGTQSLAAWDMCAPEFGFQWMSELVILWNTGKVRMRNFGSLFTRVVWYCRSGLRHPWNHPAKSIYSNVLVARKVPHKERLHPSEKPIAITNFLVSLLTNPDDLVLDPFCGAGSTLVSAALCDRDWLGCDMDSRYADIAARRVSQADEEEVEPAYLWINGKLEAI